MTPDWDAYALTFIREHGADGRTFTANDLWSAGLDEPPTASRIGIVLKHAAKEGIIRRTGIEMNGTHRGHGGIIMRWQVNA